MSGGDSPRRSISTDDLAIGVDRDADVPIGVQLAWALRSAVATAERGAQLPALREIAAATGVNVNTIRAVLQRLVREGLIVTRQGAGTFVAGPGGTNAAASEIAAAAAREANACGVDPRDVAAQLYVHTRPPARLTGSAAAGLDRRRQLRLQIAALELMAAEWEGPSPPARARSSLAEAAPRLLTEQELQQTRDALVRQLAAADPELHRDESSHPTAGAPAKRRATKRASARTPSIRPATT
jgi:DNA-binding transcriptional regulator YhcF (GntR family)